MKVWRLGFHLAPCEFAPHDICTWEHRFDDPQRKYRTLYSAKSPLTCLREVLCDLRRNEQALEDFERVFPDQREIAKRGVVSLKWRQKHVLVRAQIESPRPLVDIENKSTLKLLAEPIAPQLSALGLKTLSVAVLRRRERMVTKPISRVLFNAGECGVRFRSHLDTRPCFVIFEGRAKLRELPPKISMTKDDPNLIRVCREFKLVIEGKNSENS